MTTPPSAFIPHQSIASPVFFYMAITATAMALPAVCNGAHARRTPWRGSASLFLRIFGQSARRWPDVDKMCFATNLANDACHMCRNTEHWEAQPLETTLQGTAVKSPLNILFRSQVRFQAFFIPPKALALSHT